MNENRAELLRQQKKEIEDLEAQVEETAPLIQDLWKRYIATGDDVPSVDLVALWLIKGDLHDIRNAILQAAGAGDPEDLHWEFDELVPLVTDRIEAIAAERSS